MDAGYFTRAGRAMEYECLRDKAWAKLLTPNARLIQRSELFRSYFFEVVLPGDRLCGISTSKSQTFALRALWIMKNTQMMYPTTGVMALFSRRRRSYFSKYFDGLECEHAYWRRNKTRIFKWRPIRKSAWPTIYPSSVTFRKGNL